MKRIVVILALLALLTGCNTDVSSRGNYANVEEYHLPDGTRCAVLIGYQKGGISCDWGSSR